MLKLGTGPRMCFSPEGDAGAAGGGDATGGTTTAGAGAGAGDKGAGSQTTAPQLAWLPGASPEDIGYVQTKGWDKSANPTEVILRSYQNLEKVFGADKAGNTVMLPGEQADQKTVDAFFNKLGRPDAVDKYTAPKFEGMNPELDKGLRETGYKLGLTDKQLNGLAAWNNETTKAVQTQLTESAQLELAQQQEKLNKEWGAAKDERIGIARQAAEKLGWNENTVNGLQQVLGFDGVMKLAYELGTKVGEGKFVSDGSGRGEQAGAMAPEQAKLALNNLVNDQNFMKAWGDKAHPGHQDAMDKKAQLTRWSIGAK